MSDATAAPTTTVVPDTEDESDHALTAADAVTFPPYPRHFAKFQKLKLQLTRLQDTQRYILDTHFRTDGDADASELASSAPYSSEDLASLQDEIDAVQAGLSKQWVRIQNFLRSHSDDEEAIKDYASRLSKLEIRHDEALMFGRKEMLRFPDDRFLHHVAQRNHREMRSLWKLSRKLAKKRILDEEQ